MATKKTTKNKTSAPRTVKPVNKTKAKRAVAARKPAVAKRATVSKTPTATSAKPSVKKTVNPKKAVKKPTVKKTTLKKPTVKKATVKKTAVKKAPAKKAWRAATKTSATRKQSPAPAVALPTGVVSAKPLPERAHFSKRDLQTFRTDLIAMRERITGQSGAMRTAALQRSDESNPEEDGTDAFLRLQTLEQVGSQYQVIANIDEALRAIEKGHYGVCDMCGKLISKARLAVLPFAKNCIHCQSEMEKKRRRGGRW